MGPEGSLLCSQEPTTAPYTEPDETSHLLSLFPKIYSDIIFPSEENLTWREFNIEH